MLFDLYTDFSGQVFWHCHLWKIHSVKGFGIVNSRSRCFSGTILFFQWSRAMVFLVVIYGCESWTVKKAEHRALLNCGVGEDSWEFLGLQGDPTSPFLRRSFFGRNDAKGETPVLWPPHAKSWLIWKDWCWEGLGAGGEGDDRGWDGWMASLTRWMWIWVNSGSWWWTGRPGVLRFMGSQRVGHDWVTELKAISDSMQFLSHYQ